MITDRHFERVLPVLILVSGMALGNTRFAFCQNAMPSSPQPAVSSGNNQFAFDLFKNVASGDKNANVFFSPVSISTALAMAYAGSQGETQKQMAQVLHFTGSQQEVASGFHTLMTSMSQPANNAYQLNIANALWAQKNTRFVAEFTNLMSTYYSGEFNSVNFGDAQQTLATINHWVAGKTANKIPQLLHPGDISALTRLVLTNAVYFKGDWTTPFVETLTQPENFTTGDGAQKQVPMMHRTGRMTYAQSSDLQMLELPYRGNEQSMLILLPRAGAPDPWSNFTWEKLQQLRKQMTETKVILSLPRFKLEDRLSLAPSLSQMGMPDAFSRTANFSGITGESGWHISAVIHDAVIDVNEKGTEAAAATGVAISTLAMRREPEPVIFRADHPFLYMIVHKPSNSILFMGRLSNPPAGREPDAPRP